MDDENGNANHSAALHHRQLCNNTCGRSPWRCEDRRTARGRLEKRLPELAVHPSGVSASLSATVVIFWSSEEAVGLCVGWNAFKVARCRGEGTPGAFF